jgi:hypothetical protein
VASGSGWRESGCNTRRFGYIKVLTGYLGVLHLGAFRPPTPPHFLDLGVINAGNQINVAVAAPAAMISFLLISNNIAAAHGTPLTSNWKMFFYVPLFWKVTRMRPRTQR